MSSRSDGPNLDDLAGFTQTAPAGEFVFRAGDSGHHLFVVQEGQVELLTGDDSSRVVLVDPGGVFGEWSFFEAKPRELSARTVSEVRLLRIDRQAFDRISAEEPQIAVALVRQLAQRAHDVLRDATARVAPPVAAPAAPAASPEPLPAADRGAPRLVESESGTEFVLDGIDEATVGRPDRATGFVPEVDLAPLDAKRTLSRRHAKLVRHDDAFFVREEAGTRNGTFVNGERITTGKEVELHDGDFVQFGFVKTVFQWR